MVAVLIKSSWKFCQQNFLISEILSPGIITTGQNGSEKRFGMWFDILLQESENHKN